MSLSVEVKRAGGEKPSEGGPGREESEQGGQGAVSRPSGRGGPRSGGP